MSSAKIECVECVRASAHVRTYVCAYRLCISTYVCMSVTKSDRNEIVNIKDGLNII